VGGCGRPGASRGVLSFSLRSPLTKPPSVIDVAYWHKGDMPRSVGGTVRPSVLAVLMFCRQAQRHFSPLISSGLSRNFFVRRSGSEQFCTDSCGSIGAGSIIKGTASTGSRHVRSQSVPTIRRRGPTLGQPVQNRRRETDVDRSCVHVGASGVAERAHFRQLRQSAQAGAI
jgi:hypothetical protein